MTTAIVSAMHEELAAVLALLRLPTPIRLPVSVPVAAPVAEVSAAGGGLVRGTSGERVQVRGGREFWRGQLHGQDVVAVLSRIGKVAAATTATVLIERFAVKRMIFTGVAGGLAAGVKRGDVVVADSFLQHDLDASPIFPKYEVPLYGVSRFSTDADLSAQLIRAVRLALPNVSLHRGLVLSGDRFVSTTAEGRALQLALPQALAVEMEGAAIAQVCHDYGIPFAAVRTVSDRADDEAHGDFTHFIQEVASHYSAAIVEALLRQEPPRQP